MTDTLQERAKRIKKHMDNWSDFHGVGSEGKEMGSLIADQATELEAITTREKQLVKTLEKVKVLSGDNAKELAATNFIMAMKFEEIYKVTTEALATHKQKTKEVCNTLSRES